MYCVEYQICQHYFIPEINFFEGRLIDPDHQALQSCILEVSRDCIKALPNTETILKI